MGIAVLPPSVNESFSGFTVVKKGGERDEIRFGLTTIKNFGEGVARSIIEERERGGRFRALGDFLSRVKDKNLNKKSLETLIKSGALDELGERGQMFANMERLLAYAKESAAASAAQTSLFGSGNSGWASGNDFPLAPAPPAEAAEKLAWEKELLGLYISGHPLDKFRAVLEKREANIKKIKEEMRNGMSVVIAGIVEELRPVVTKNGEPMAFVRIADLSSAIEAIVFPRVMAEHKKMLAPGNCLAVKGRLSRRNGEVSIIAEKLKPLT